MTHTVILRYCALLAGAALPTAASAFFFIVPIPSVGKPPALDALIGALEKSDETKAVAYVSEDKTFGSKYWVWGHYAGHVTQEEANRTALSRCEASLANAKAQSAGGKGLYDFGSKTCELYDFQNKTVSARVNQAPPPAAPSAATGAAEQQAFPAVPPYPYAAAQPEQQSAISSAPPNARPASVQPPPNAVGPAPTVSAAATPPAAPTAQTPAATPSLPQPAQADKAPPVEGSTARRLRELNDLLKQGLITESEYKEKRKAILSAL